MHGESQNRKSSLNASSAQEGADAWRDEVASRLVNYRSRRRRVDLDLSLRLDFESQRQANRDLLMKSSAKRAELDNASRPAEAENVQEAKQVAELFSDVLAEGTPTGVESVIIGSPEITAVPQSETPAPLSKPARQRKIIEFPRPAVQQFYLPVEELADPVTQSPRILEAAPITEDDLLPIVPAITLDEMPQSQNSEADFELPLQPAPLGLRVFATVVDLALIATALATFGLVLAKVFPALASSVPALLHNRSALVAPVAVLGLFWLGYYCLQLGFGARTAGMWAAGLHVVTFDGAAARQLELRRRAAAIVISALSGGLGFAWAFFDEDRLGWHDRMSRTYVSQ